MSVNPNPPNDPRNPKGLARAPQVIDDQAVTDVADSGKGKTYVIRYIYNDGTVEDEYRSYSGKGMEQDPVIKTVPKADNEDQVARWKEQQRTATTQGNAAVTGESLSAPPNQRFNVRAGPKDADHPDGIYYYPNPNFVEPGTAAKPGTTTEPVTGPGGNTNMVTWEILPDGSKGRILEETPATKAQLDAINGPRDQSGTKREPVPDRPGFTKVTAAKKDASGNETTNIYYEDAEGNRLASLPGQSASASKRVPVQGRPGVYQVSKGTKDSQGNEASDTYFEDEAGNRIATPSEPGKIVTYNGEQYEQTTGPDGAIVLRKPQVQGQTAAPDIERNRVEYGNIVPELEKRRAQINELARTGAIDEATRTKMLTEEYNSAIMRKSEIENVLSNQNTIQTQQINQRGQDINVSSINTGFANNALERAVKNTMEPYAGRAGSGELQARALNSLLGLQKEYAKSIPGALAAPATVPMTAAQQGVLGINPFAGGQTPVTINIGGGGGGTGGSLGNMQSALSPGAPQVDPGPGGGTGGGAPDPMQHLQPILQQYDDGTDPDWTSALARVAQESFA